MLRTRLPALLLAATTMLVAGCAGDDVADPEGPGTSTEAVDATDAVEDLAAESDEGGEAAYSADDDADQQSDNASGDFPVTFESAGQAWTLEAPPERIVSLSPTATEILFAVGAGDQVVAVDSFSNYPPEAPTTELSGFDPNIEAITSYDPDLVIIASDANDLVAGLTELEIPVLISAAPADIDSGYDDMAEIGLVTGNVDETADAITAMRDEMAAAVDAAPEIPLRVYHELDDSFFSASSNGFIGAAYAELGAENIADAADSDGTGFPQLTEEYILEADPELIVITDQVAYTPDDVAARPGWDQVTAVRNGNIVVVEADIASRWGPRLPQFVSALTEAMASAAASS